MRNADWAFGSLGGVGCRRSECCGTSWRDAGKGDPRRNLGGNKMWRGEASLAGTSPRLRRGRGLSIEAAQMLLAAALEFLGRHHRDNIAPLIRSAPRGCGRAVKNSREALREERPLTTAGLSRLH
jgi:hypothetical protein